MSQSRRSGWRRTSHGFYVPTQTAHTPEQRALEQSIRLPVGGAVTGWAACRLHGANFFDGLAPDGVTELPVPLALGATGNIRANNASVLSRFTLTANEVETVAGIPCAERQRALLDVVRDARNVRAAVVAVDMMAAADLMSVSQLRAYAASLGTAQGKQTLLDALDLASERSRSPKESELRLIWVLDAGLPEPLVNQPVHDRSGRLLGIADLFDLEAGFAVEYDGADHRSAVRHAADVAREAAFRDAGCEFTRVVGRDLHDRALVVRRLRAARSRAQFRDPSARDWVLGDPGESLDQRIAEREISRALHE